MIYLPADAKDLDIVMWNGKRFTERRPMAYEIVKRLKSMGDFETLEIMAKYVSSHDKKNGKLHHAFQATFDAQLSFIRKVYIY